MKKKLSMLLAATMIASMLPTGVFAASTNNISHNSSASTNSEWSVHAGNIQSVPQLTLKAENRILKGEQITLTLSGAEWAFYNEDLVNTSAGYRVIPNGSALSNDWAEKNLVKAARSNVLSYDNDNGAPGDGSVSGQDPDIPYVVEQSVYGVVGGDAETQSRNFYDATRRYKAAKVLKDNSATLVGSYEARVKSLSIQYDNASGADKPGILVEYESAKKSLNEEKAKFETYKADFEKISKEMESAKIVLENKIADIKKDLVKSYATFTTAETNFKNRETIYIGAIVGREGDSNYDNGYLNNVVGSGYKDNTIGTAARNRDDARATRDLAWNAYNADNSKYAQGKPYPGDKIGTKAEVTAVNFTEVAYETANVISFRTDKELDKGDIIAIPLLSKVFGATPTVSIYSPTGAFSSGTYQFATTASGSTKASISSAVTFGDTANLNQIVISEVSPRSFWPNAAAKRTDNIRLTLPQGFVWVTNTDGKTVGKVTSNNRSITGSATINPNSDNKDNRTIQIDLNNDYTLESTMNSKIFLDQAKIKALTHTARKGDVEVSIKGDNTTQENLVIAKFGTYGISLTAKDDKVPSNIAGRSFLADQKTVQTATVIFEENVEDSWWANRKTEFEVNRGQIRAVDVKVLDDVTRAGNAYNTNANVNSNDSSDFYNGISHADLANGMRVEGAIESTTGVKVGTREKKDDEVGAYKDMGYYTTNDSYSPYMYIASKEGSRDNFNKFVMEEFYVDEAQNNISTGEYKSRAKIELTFYVEVPVTTDAADKELIISLKGAGITSADQTTLKVADIKEPLTFEWSQTDVNLGYQGVQLKPLTITENFVGGFSPVAKGSANIEMSTSDLAKAVSITGELFTNVGATVKSGDVLLQDGKVLRRSTTLSKMEFNPKVGLMRYIPEGKYALNVNNVDELGTDIGLSNYLNVITAASNKGGKYASDVAIIVDGTTKEMKIDGKTMAMDAPAFIKDDRTMLPLRDVAHALGISDDAISFDDGYAKIAANGIFIAAKNGSKELIINGTPVQMDTEAYTDPVLNRMYLPLAYVANAFGVKPRWDDTTKTAYLNESIKTDTPATTK